MKLTDPMPKCTRCGRTCFPVNVSTRDDVEAVYIPGCNCSPRWPHDPITPEEERRMIGWTRVASDLKGSIEDYLIPPKGNSSSR